MVVELIGAAPPLVADRDGATGNVLSNGGDESDSPRRLVKRKGTFFAPLRLSRSDRQPREHPLPEVTSVILPLVVVTLIDLHNDPGPADYHLAVPPCLPQCVEGDVLRDQLVPVPRVPDTEFLPRWNGHCLQSTSPGAQLGTSGRTSSQRAACLPGCLLPPCTLSASGISAGSSSPSPSAGACGTPCRPAFQG